MKGNNIVMVNPNNHVKVVTNKDFQKNWERLGFIATSNVIILQKAC